MTNTSLFDDMAKNGLPCHHELSLDAQLHRYGKNGPSDSKDEWYWGIQTEQFTYCTYGSWSSEEKFTYRSGNISQEQRLAFEREVEQARKKYYEEKLHEQQKAAARAQDILSKCVTANEHPYKDRKHISSDILLHEQNVIVPFQNINGEVETVQSINADGEKKFLYQGKTKGNFHLIGQLKSPKKIYICEGFATGHSIYQATHETVIVCGSLNNIIPVTIQIKVKYPETKLYLCQDVGEVADKNAKQWKDKFNGVVYKPKSDQKGYDFNDMHVHQGIEKVSEYLVSPRYPSINLYEMMENDYPPPKWVIDNLLAENSSMLIHATGGAGKSMICAEMALSLCDGSTFIAWRVEKPRRVLYIDSELPMNLLAYRLQQSIERRKTECAADFFKIICTNDKAFQNNKPINLYDLESLEMLEQDVEEADVIFLDNLQNLTFDPLMEGKENKAECWQLIEMWLKKWKQRGKTFVVVHHENKAGQLRGTSRLNGDFDQLVQITKPKDIPQDHEGFQVTINPYKIRAAEQKHERPRLVSLLPKENAYFKHASKNKGCAYELFRGWKVDEVK